MLTESQVLAAEIERVNPQVPTLFERDDVFYSTIEKKNTVEVSGRDMKVPLELRPGGNFGHYDPDGGDLGVGDGPTFDKGTIPVAHTKYGVQWTKKAEWGTDDARKSVINIFRHLMSKSMAEYRRMLDALCMTDGTGTIATIGAVTVNTPVGFDTITCNATGDGLNARLLRFGQSVSVYNAALTVKRTATELKIIYYDGPGKQFRIATGTAGITAGDKIVVGGLSATPPTSIYGVPYHMNGQSTGFWLGFDRSTTPEVRGNRINAASSSLALPYARRALNAVGDRVGKDSMQKVTAWMHPAQKQAYEELGQLVSVINRNSKGGDELDLYFDDNMRIAGAPIKTSFSWDKTRIDFIVNDAWGRAELKEVGFYENEGKKIFEMRGASGGLAASMIFYIVSSWNLFMSNPVAGAYIDGLTIPTGY